MQEVTNGIQMVMETMEAKANSDVNRKKHGRGRGHSTSSRTRSAKNINDQTRSQNCPSTASPSNGQLENSNHKVCLVAQTDWIWTFPFDYCLSK